jgi:hypothetical protein
MVGVIVFALIVLSIACFIWSSNLSEGKKRGQVKLVAMLLMGVAFVSLSIFDLVGIHQSERDSVSGVIQNLKQRHGKNSSSSFQIQMADGSQIAVHAAYDGKNLVNGESVHAEVLRYHATLLSLSVLDGAYAGWQHVEGDGTISGCFLLLLGVLCIWGGLRKWRSEPNAPEVPDYRTPANGIDDQSLLHLNRDKD